MAAEKTQILFPVGRMVQGDLYEPNDKDADGNPLLVKNGANAGQPRVEYFFSVAIPKDGRPWWETEWGRLVYQTGAAAFPHAVGMPTFSWKIADGDDATPKLGRGGKPGTPNNQREGWAGCWIVKFASGFAPKVVNADGSAELTQIGAVKPGYFVQVYGNSAGNGSTQKPGVRLNPSGVALAAYGTEIKQGADLSSVGFGQGVQLPPGASVAPLAGMTAVPAAAAPAGFPGAPAAMPAMPGAGVPAAMPMMPAAGAVPGMPAGLPQIPGAAPIVVQPNPGFLAVPGGVPGVPVGFPVPGAPAAPVRQMTAKAGGYAKEVFYQQGWTDASLIAEGYMTA